MNYTPKSAATGAMRAWRKEEREGKDVLPMIPA
jgi:hypothetical protein